jgi:hypothetical protein
MSDRYFVEPVRLTNPGGIRVYGVQFFRSLVDEPPLIDAEGRVLTREYWERVGWRVDDCAALAAEGSE